MKAPLSIENYEAWLLDLYEGRLSAEETEQLRAFALCHPELDIDPDPLTLPVIDREAITADFRESLFRSENDHPHEDLIAYIEGNLDKEKRARLERQLATDPLLSAEVDAYRRTFLQPDDESFPGGFALKKSPDEAAAGDTVLSYFEASLDDSAVPVPGNVAKEIFERELRLISATRLSPDQAISFPGKDKLKRGRVLAMFPARTVFRAAAVLALIAGLVSLAYYVQTGDPTPEIAVVENPPGNVIQPAGTATPSPATAFRQEEEEMKASVRRKSGSVRSKAIPATVHSDPSSKEMESPVALGIPEDKVQEPIEAAVAATTIADTTANASLAVSDEKPVPTEELPWLDEEDNEEEPARNTIWQRLASLAGQANKLGVKAIDGTPAGDEGFRLSLFAYSVEKK
jgi:hypothetical protein